MRPLTKLAPPAIAASLLLAACGRSSESKPTTSAAAAIKPAAQQGASTSGASVKTASNPALGTILTDSNGMTLYHLSGEHNGKFICTSSACLGVWHPLVAAAGGPPTGEVNSLATVKRADGTMQVTYKGSPLYTFAKDTHPGQTNGQGIKDVGTWSAATTGASTSASSAASSSATSTSSAAPESSGGGYAY
jgi:predicted lipoprotein with Yx(FWY)xxD motif